MKYYIDGYNLLFSCAFDIDDFEQAREKLLDLLATYAKILHLSITCVFDAHETQEECKSHSYGTVKVVFTAHRETADDYFASCFSTRKPNSTLVTADKNLQRRIQPNIAVISPATFLMMLKKKIEKEREKFEKPAPKNLKRIVKTEKPEQADLISQRYNGNASQNNIKEKGGKKLPPLCDFKAWEKIFSRLSE